MTQCNNRNWSQVGRGGHVPPNRFQKNFQAFFKMSPKGISAIDRCRGWGEMCSQLKGGSILINFYHNWFWNFQNFHKAFINYQNFRALPATPHRCAYLLLICLKGVHTTHRWGFLGRLFLSVGVITEVHSFGNVQNRNSREDIFHENWKFSMIYQAKDMPCNLADKFC